MARRRHRPTSATGARRDQEALIDAERAQQSRPAERPRRGGEAARRDGAGDHSAGDRRDEDLQLLQHDIELEAGIGETDGLAEVDGVAFIGPRLHEPPPFTPRIDPNRELAVVGRLMHREVPSIELEWMPGEWVDLRTLAQRQVIVYCQPGTDTESLVFDEHEVLGVDATECRGFADWELHFAAAHHTVVGISSQTAQRQHALATEQMLPHVVLSDDGLDLAEEMGLPTFEIDGMRLYERLTFVAKEGRVRKVFYPVTDPVSHAAEVAEWLHEEVESLHQRAESLHEGDC